MKNVWLFRRQYTYRHNSSSSFLHLYLPCFHSSIPPMNILLNLFNRSAIFNTIYKCVPNGATYPQTRIAKTSTRCATPGRTTTNAKPTTVTCVKLVRGRVASASRQMVRLRLIFSNTSLLHLQYFQNGFI